MCKSIAEGGERCSFHLSQGVQTGVTSYAAALTGVPQAEARDAYASLLEEGAGAPEPSREDVDGFLTKEVFRVRHEPTLTEPKRKSILGRLQAAIGKVTPDGATFHAWKNVVAEAWARSRRRAAAVFMVSGLAFGLGGCATGPSQASPAVTSGPVATASVTPGTVVQGTKPVVDKETFTGSAVKKFGQAEVQDAYKAAAEFTVNNTMAPRTADKSPADLTLKDFDGVRASLTPSARKSFDKSFAGRDQETQNMVNVSALAYYGLNDEGFNVRDDYPVTDLRVTNSKAEADGARIKMTSDVTCTGHYTGPKGEKVKSGCNKTLTLWMIKDAKGAWKIDGWQANFAGTLTQPDNI